MKRVTIFTTPTCPHCKTAKDYLKSKGVDFEEKDVSRDIYARDEMMKLNIQGVPALKIDGQIIVGFDRQKIDELLSYTVIPCEQCATKLRFPTGKGKIKVTCPNCSHQFITES